MHQMRISTNDAQSKMLEIQNMKVKLDKSDQCSAKRLGPKTSKDLKAKITVINLVNPKYNKNTS